MALADRAVFDLDERTNDQSAVAMDGRLIGDLQRAVPQTNVPYRELDRSRLDAVLDPIGRSALFRLG